MDNTTPQEPQHPYDQQPPSPGGNELVARLNAFRRQRPVLAGIAALIAVCVVCAICGGIVQGISGGGTAAGSSNGSSAQSAAQASGPTATPKPTPTNTPTPKWTTVQTFTGNGVKKTQTFTVPDDWKLVWSCKPSSFYGNSYNLIVTVYNSDGSMSDLAINTMCQSGNTSDSTEEHSGGQIYLDVNSEGYWQLQVQELK